MRTNMTKPLCMTACLLFTSVAWGQSDPQMITVPLSRPGETMSLEISIMSAHIEVIGEDRQDVEFAITVAEGNRKIITPSGTKSITGGAYSMEVDEDDNQVSVDMDWRANKVHIVARIPKNANLELSTVNDGDIVVSNIIGSLELENVNGPITATNITGSVIAESVNDDIYISFDNIDEAIAMALTSVNGDLTLGLPGNAAVQLHIDSSEGEIISDFEVDVLPSKPVVNRSTDRGGVEVTVESAIVANLNGGGTVIKMKTLNGDIQIRDSSN